MASKIIHFILLTLGIKNILSFELLTKYGSLICTTKYQIFESKAFSIGDKMHFMVKTKDNRDYEKTLLYEYFNSTEEAEKKIGLKEFPYFSVKPIILDLKIYKSKKKYFTIKKNSDEFNGSNGDYLLLFYSYDEEIVFENIKTDKGKLIKALTLIIEIFIGSIFLGALVGIFFCIFCRNRGTTGAVVNKYPSPVINSSPSTDESRNENDAQVIQPRRIFVATMQIVRY